MKSKMTIIPKGSFLTISTGCYSDYYVRGVFRALRDIDADALLKDWLDTHPEQRGNYAFKEYDFLAHIAREGYLEPIDSFEWHISDFNRVAEMQVTGPTQWEAPNHTDNQSK